MTTRTPVGSDMFLFFRNIIQSLLLTENQTKEKIFCSILVHTPVIFYARILLTLRHTEVFLFASDYFLIRALEFFQIISSKKLPGNISNYSRQKITYFQSKVLVWKHTGREFTVICLFRLSVHMYQIGPKQCQDKIW